PDGSASSSTPSASAPSRSPSASASPSQTSQQLVNVNALQLQGKTCDEASSILSDNKLGANCEPGNAATSPDQVGKVDTVTPTGSVPAGTIITL
ncbi:hypothetical protein, partial [Staphylococcus aureus]